MGKLLRWRFKKKGGRPESEFFSRYSARNHYFGQNYHRGFKNEAGHKTRQQVNSAP